MGGNIFVDLLPARRVPCSWAVGRVRRWVLASPWGRRRRAAPCRSSAAAVVAPPTDCAGERSSAETSAWAPSARARGPAAGWGSSGRTGGEGRRASLELRYGTAPTPFPAAAPPVVASSVPALVGRVLVDPASVAVAPLVRVASAAALAPRCLATVAWAALETAPVARATARLVSTSTFWLATASTVAVATTAPTPVALASRALLRVTVALWAFAVARRSWPSEDPAPDTSGPEVAGAALTARTVAGTDAGTVRSG